MREEQIFGLVDSFLCALIISCSYDILFEALARDARVVGRADLFLSYFPS